MRYIAWRGKLYGEPDHWNGKFNFCHKEEDLKTETKEGNRFEIENFSSLLFRFT